MGKINQMVKELRTSVNQSVEGIALLLQISPAQYRKLEEDWLPDDEFLERMCALFSWNFQEIQRLARNTPNLGANSAKHSTPPKSVPPAAETRYSTEPMATQEVQKNVSASALGEMLEEARIQVSQSPEGIATLLNIPVDEYLTVETGAIPSEDLLRRICALFGWNYNQTRQKVLNATSLFTPMMPPLSLKELQAKNSLKDLPPLPLDAVGKETLADKMLHSRNEYGQTTDGIALLLNISEDHYLALEQGTLLPDAELLKRIATLFRWNYRTLQLLVRNENIELFQPLTPINKLPESSSKTKLTQIIEEIQQVWALAPEAEQEMLLNQMRLIRDTLKRYQKEVKPIAKAPVIEAQNSELNQKNNNNSAQRNKGMPKLAPSKIRP